MKKELLNGLTPEQIEKAKVCKNSEELLKLAEEEDINLTEEQLEAVNGGFCNPDGNINFPNKCPKCGSTNTKLTGQHDIGRIAWDTYDCLDCHSEYRVVKNQY